MTLEESLRATVLADPAVAGLIQSRMKPDIAMQNATLPCLVYQTISALADEASYTFDGPGLKRTKIDFTYLGRKWAEAKALADAVADVLADYEAGGTLLGSSPGVPILGLFLDDLRDIGFDEVTAVHRYDQTIEVVHR